MTLKIKNSLLRYHPFSGGQAKSSLFAGSTSPLFLGDRRLAPDNSILNWPTFRAGIDGIKGKDGIVAVATSDDLVAACSAKCEKPSNVSSAM